MSHRELLPLLLPPVSYAPAGRMVAASLTVEADLLDRIERQAGAVAGSVTPLDAVDLLVDWERVLGLTPAADAAYRQRLGAVLAKLRETGGLSIPYFVDLAGRLGYVITIDEFQPFYCDYSILDVDRVYAADVIWCWQVNVGGGTVGANYFRASESTAGEALLSFSDPVIESVFDDLKPAHTFCTFSYEEQP